MNYLAVSIHKEEKKKNLYQISWVGVHPKEQSFNLIYEGNCLFYSTLKSNLPTINSHFNPWEEIKTLEDTLKLLKNISKEYNLKIITDESSQVFLENINPTVIKTNILLELTKENKLNPSNESFYKASNLGRLLIKNLIA